MNNELVTIEADFQQGDLPDRVLGSAHHEALVAEVVQRFQEAQGLDYTPDVRRIVAYLLEHHNGNASRVAGALGISRTGVLQWMQLWGITLKTVAELPVAE